MTRIIAGTAGGRRLVTPAGERTRPTSDRVREALFSVLEARGAVEGARVLDLFAGSGALGLEAASRGAAGVTLVDSSRQAVDAARRNAVTVAGGAAGPVDVVLSPALRYLRRPGVGGPGPARPGPARPGPARPDPAQVESGQVESAQVESAWLDLVLLDPPYALGEDDLAEHLAALVGGGRLAPGAVVVVERDRRSPQPAWPPGLVAERERRYGETVLWIAVRAAQ